MSSSPPPVHTIPDKDPRRTQSAHDLHVARTQPLVPPSPSPSPASPSSTASSRSFDATTAINNNNNNNNNSGRRPSSQADSDVVVVQVSYPQQDSLYVDLYSRDDGKGAHVKAFRRKPDGSMANAEAHGGVRVNDALFAINDLVVTDMLFPAIIQAARTAKFPLTLTFHCKPPPTANNNAPSPSKSTTSASSAMSTWGAKFGQMVENGLRRSGSFERRNELASNSSASYSVETPTSQGSASKFRPWGDSTPLDRVKNTSSDGVKTLLRMMGKGRPEEDRDIVATWMEHLKLCAERADPASPSQTVTHSTPLVAMTVGGRILGVREDDLNEYAMTWFRKTPNNDLILIKGVRSGRYVPSVDDVGCRISLQCQSVRFPQFSKVVELAQALTIDPTVDDIVDVLLEAGTGSFSATLATNEHDSFQLKMDPERVTLVKVSEDEEEAGVVTSVEYQSHLQVLLDPTDEHRFSLKVQAFGAMLGNREGDTCDMKRKRAQMSTYSCFFLIAQNPQHRDILTLLIRKFRAKKLSAEDEKVAHTDELNMFMDPASVPQAASPSIAPAAEQTNSGLVRHSFVLGNGGVVPTGASEASKPGISPRASGRFSDMFGLDLDLDDEHPDDGSMGKSPPHGPSAATSTFLTNSNDAFVQDRMASQEREIKMLQEKLATLSVLLKSTEHEKTELVSAIEVKHQRIELQQRKIEQFERLNVLVNSQARELISIKAKLDEETRAHSECREQVAALIATRDSLRANYVDVGNQTEWEHLGELEDPTTRVCRLEELVDELQEQIQKQEMQLIAVQESNHRLESERNGFRAKTIELGKEMKKLVGSNRTVEDVEQQLAERSELAMKLAVARAEAKRASDEMKEYKDALDCVVKQQGMGDKGKDTQRVLSQNLELQRLVNQLTDSLQETKEQLTALKRINAALLERLQRANPDAGGSILESPPMSPQSVASSCVEPIFSDEEDDDDSDDDGTTTPHFRQQVNIEEARRLSLHLQPTSPANATSHSGGHRRSL
ncbi:TPA: hypothetical protein N0F65_007867 [Lagenidium giganteum]|uniref:PDZ domain-containing protein n=1 Tax=Lagenidium giganteum TaxID=4803 RepID=A0AAV2YYT0_9STRA|nr:TPA: hypothetical protein N0F65_007867 [Lagenidium giganteum]